MTSDLLENIICFDQDRRAAQAEALIRKADPLGPCFQKAGFFVQRFYDSEIGDVINLSPTAEIALKAHWIKPASVITPHILLVAPS